MAYEFDKSGKDMSRGTHDKVIHKIENCKCKKVYQTEESLSFSIARQFVNGAIATNFFFYNFFFIVKNYHLTMKY